MVFCFVYFFHMLQIIIAIILFMMMIIVFLIHIITFPLDQSVWYDFNIESDFLILCVCIYTSFTIIIFFFNIPHCWIMYPIWKIENLFFIDYITFIMMMMIWYTPTMHPLLKAKTFGFFFFSFQKKTFNLLASSANHHHHHYQLTNYNDQPEKKYCFRKYYIDGIATWFSNGANNSQANVNKKIK